MRDNKKIYIRDDKTIKNMKEHYDRRIKDINRAFDSQILKIQKAYDREVELTNQQHLKSKNFNEKLYQQKKNITFVKEHLDRRQQIRLDKLKDHILDQESKFVKEKRRSEKENKTSLKKQKNILGKMLNEKEKYYENLLGEIDIRNKKNMLRKNDLFKNKIKDLKNDHQNQLEILEQNKKNTLRKLRKVHGGIVTRLNEKSMWDLNELRNELSTDRGHMPRGTERELHEISKKNREEFAKKLNKAIAMYEESMSNKDVEIKNAIRQYENKLRTVKNKFEFEIRAINKIQTEYRKADKEQSQTELRELREEYEKRIVKQREKLEDKIKNMQDQHSIKITQIIQQNSNEKITSQVKHHKEIKKKLANLRKAYEQNIKRNGLIREDLEKSYEERLKNLKSSLKRRYQLQKIRVNG